MFKQKELIRNYEKLGYILKAKSNRFGNATKHTQNTAYNSECIEVSITSDGINFSRTKAGEWWKVCVLQSKCKEQPEDRRLDDVHQILCITADEEVTGVNLSERENLFDPTDSSDYTFAGLWLEFEVFNVTTGELGLIDWLITSYDTELATNQ